MTNLPPPRPSAWDLDVLEVLEARDGIPTEVRLVDNSTLIVHNVAIGYDSGDEHAHVSTNISPEVDGTTFDFFFTDNVVSLINPENGITLLTRPADPTH